MGGSHCGGVCGGCKEQCQSAVEDVEKDMSSCKSGVVWLPTAFVDLLSELCFGVWRGRRLCAWSAS
jgi:hypothetical protein